jgi:perosamine synthetase
MVPWFDSAEADACYEYMKSGGFVMEFKKTQEFEQMLASYIGVKHCFVVVNGTISLSLALWAVNVGVGDEVIIPDLTMIASANATKLIGAVPVFADISPKSLTITVDTIKHLITEKTKAVMHVSLNTRTEDLAELRQFCDEKGLFLIEDSAQSLGSFINGKHIGTFGHIGSFSFSAPKIISTGQGGALVTDDDALALRLMRLKNFGRSSGGNDIYVDFGINCKFTDIQAIIGIEQMKKLPWRVSRIRQMWDLYYKELSNVTAIEMFKATDPGWIPWFIDIFVDRADDLAAFLKTKNIGSRRVYPALHSQSIYPESNNLSFPVTEQYSKRGLWLPSSTQLTDTQILYICNTIKEFYNLII